MKGRVMDFTINDECQMVDGKTQVISTFTNSLHDHEKPEAINCLNLSDKEIRFWATRNISMQHLQHLNMSKNWLHSMGGVRQFINLVQLDLSHNKIRQVEGIESLTKLQMLDLSHNDIRTYLSVRALSLCSTIRVLHLHNNIVANLVGYRARISSLLPHAVILDGIRFPRHATMKKCKIPVCHTCGHQAIPIHVARPKDRTTNVLRIPYVALLPQANRFKTTLHDSTPEKRNSPQRLKSVNEGNPRSDTRTQAKSHDNSLVGRKLAVSRQSPEVPSFEHSASRFNYQMAHPRAYTAPRHIMEIDSLTSIENVNHNYITSPLYSNVPRRGHRSLDDMFIQDLSYHTNQIKSDENIHSNQNPDTHDIRFAWKKCVELQQIFDTKTPLDEGEILSLAQIAAESLPFENVHLGSVLEQFSQLLSSPSMFGSKNSSHCEKETTTMDHLSYQLNNTSA